MGKRGPKPKGKVKIEWSEDFAYAVGLLVSDGNLSPDGRHVVFTSKDFDLAQSFLEALRITGHIGRKARGKGLKKEYFVVQFSDTLFYHFLNSIGLSSNKSKTIGPVLIPTEYFFDFLRGSFDGDGCTYSYWDPRWKSSFMFYTTFVSASKSHISWLQEEIAVRLGIRGHITGDGRRTVFQLKYAKADSMILLRRMFYSAKVRSLSRKRLKIEEMLRIVSKSLVEETKLLTNNAQVA